MKSEGDFTHLVVSEDKNFNGSMLLLDILIVGQLKEQMMLKGWKEMQSNVAIPHMIFNTIMTYSAHCSTQTLNEDKC